MNPNRLVDGATRLMAIAGDPVAQVKSPSGVSHALAERGMNALCVPAHVAPCDLGCRTATGVDMFRVAQGLIVGFLLDG